MKRFSTLFVTAAVMLAGAISAQAVTPLEIKMRKTATRPNLPYKVKSVYDEQQMGKAELPTKQNIIAGTRQADNALRAKKLNGDATDMATVKCKYVTSDLYKSPGVTIMNRDACYEPWDYDDEEWSSTTVDIPKGTYDFVARFWCQDWLVESPSLAYVFKEDVVVDGNMELTFDVSEATNHIHFESYLSDGSKALLPKVKFLDAEPWVEWDMSDCTVEDICFNYFIINPNFGKGKGDSGIIVQGTGNAGYRMVKDDGSIMNNETSFDILVNNVSDEYHFVQLRTMILENGIDIATLHHKGITDQPIVNDPADYIYYNDTFTLTPARETIGNVRWKSQTKSGIIIDDLTQGGYNVMTKSETPSIGICSPKDTNGLDFHTTANIENIDACWEYYLDWGDGNLSTEYATSGIVGLPVIWNGSEFDYINNNHSEGGNFAFQIPEDIDGNITDLPGHPAFSFTSAKKKAPYGNSAPINAFMDQTAYQSWADAKISYFGCCYIGRFGEVRNVDEINLNAQIKYNGEVICEDYDSIANTFSYYHFVEDRTPAGVYELHFRDTNVMVDDIPGFNDTYIYADKRKEDGTAPTLQMLQFKNRQGDITDRFPNASYGILEFAGGDFNFHMQEEPWHTYYDCKPQTVKVEYAPNGTEDFIELESVTEIPELYTMPGFGYFYRASLAEVKTLSPNGWFDLRITLTDESDNVQQQVISPAFKIDLLTGIASVSSDGISVYARDKQIVVAGASEPAVEVYSLGGSKVLKAVGSSIDATALTQGIYVVKVTVNGITSTHKVIIK
ncbi:MAG: T9SS type A sorting domain-containing protein [Muribaculaceae bacterium]